MSEVDRRTFLSRTAAVGGLAMVLRGHLAARGVRVNDVCPGNVESPLKMEVIEQAYQRTEVSLADLPSTLPSDA